RRYKSTSLANRVTIALSDFILMSNSLVYSFHCHLQQNNFLASILRVRTASFRISIAVMREYAFW
ncbi:MAG: hypothetical protein WD000_05110, partial [Thermodesulfobacteriota bacterium]